MIEFEHVYKTYETHNDENVALEDINIHIEEGEFVFILGHSGAGKSTFLKLIQMEEKPTKGKVFINGQLILDGEELNADAMRTSGRAMRAAKR